MALVTVSEVLRFALPQGCTVLAGQELPADQVEKLLTLFEAAVNARVQIAVTQVQEEYEASLDEQTEELVEKLDGYLEYAAKEFFTENEVAIENSLRVDLYEEFVDGLADLFRKHYVDIPEDRLDVVSSLADRVSELEERLNEKTQEAIDLEEQLLAASAQRVFNKVSEGLTTVDAEKLRSLSETVEFDGDEESLEKRISTIKEAHFGDKKTDAKPAADINEGEIVTVQVSESAGVATAASPEIQPLVDALSRIAARDRL